MLGLGLFLFFYYFNVFSFRFQKIRKVLTRVLARVLALMLVYLDYYALCCFRLLLIADWRAFVVLIFTMMCNSIALRLV